MGQSVRVTVASLPNRIFNGRVTVVGSVVHGQTRSVPVKAALDNPDGALKPGLFAQMEIVTDRSSAAAIAISKKAVVDANGKDLVFVQAVGEHPEEGEHNHQEGEHQEGEHQAGESYKPVEVILGRTAGNLIEVKSGLKDGDRVVTQGTTLLYAQSLRGGGTPGGEAHHDEAGEKQAAATSGGMVPWWLIIPSTTAIAAGTFYWGRRSKPTVILHDSDYKDTAP